MGKLCAHNVLLSPSKQPIPTNTAHEVDGRYYLQVVVVREVRCGTVVGRVIVVRVVRFRVAVVAASAAGGAAVEVRVVAERVGGAASGRRDLVRADVLDVEVVVARQQTGTRVVVVVVVVVVVTACCCGGFLCPFQAPCPPRPCPRGGPLRPCRPPSP